MFRTEQLDKTYQSQLRLLAVSHTGKCSFLLMLDEAEVMKRYFLFSSIYRRLSPNSLSELKASAQRSDPLRQTSYKWFVTLRESAFFTNLCIFKHRFQTKWERLWKKEIIEV